MTDAAHALDEIRARHEEACNPVAYSFDDHIQAHADRATLLRLLDEERARRVEWQPIETAPRDGTQVLILQPSGKAAVGLWDKVDNGWRLSVRFVTRTFALDAGHWQHIPTPPATHKDTQDE